MASTLIAILFITAICGGISYAVYEFVLKPDTVKNKFSDNNLIYIIILVFISFIIHIICAVKYPGHKTDMNCFRAWSDMVFNDGVGKFYTSQAFHDYPPGYMYILYFVGAIKQLLHISDNSVLVRIPAIIIDLASGIFIYKIAVKKFSAKSAAIISAFYLFNPAVILNSALWGQVDTVYTFTSVLMLWLITNKKMIASYFLFALCIFIKPQSFMFFPVLIFGIIENVFLDDFSWNKFFINLGSGIGAILMIVLLSLPFGLGNIVTQYKTTLSEYPYLTINAFNFWGALGKNWSGLTAPTTVLGYIVLAGVVAYAAYVFFKSKNHAKYYYVSALIAFLTFIFGTKMHDRYAFAAMMMLLMAFIETADKRSFISYILITLSQFFNTAWVLFIYQTDINKYFQSPTLRIASLINILLCILMIYFTQKQYVKNTEETILTKAVANASSSMKLKGGKSSSKGKYTPASDSRAFGFQKSEVFAKITKIDIIAIAVIMVVYGVIALYNLGDKYACETEVMLSKNSVSIDLGKDTDISDVRYYLGSLNLDKTRPLNMVFLKEDGSTAKSESLTSGAVFYWSDQKENTTCRYIEFSAPDEDLSVKEVCIVGSDGKYITPVNAGDAGIRSMFDEQDKIPASQSFMNSTYFDEIYHARTAYEFIHHLTIYEWTHPPLGKLMIALGIMIFGMCPFGWRIVGTIIGILMIPLIYLFAKRFLKETWLSIITCLFMTFDFMHFVQTRIATIDVYVTFFIMLMFYFMFKYYSMSFYDTKLKKTFVPLALCGISTGLAIASKWTGLYAAAGLSIIFAITVYRRYREYLYARRTPNGSTDGISHSYIISVFKPNLIKTVLFCVGFFIVVPVVIYFASYIPYMMTPSGHGLKTIFENAESMYTYHSKTVLGATHPYSSFWYQWPIMTRPIWYYSNTISDNVKQGISAFGNPAVWWVGIFAFFFMVYTAIVNKDKRALFLIIAYLAQYLPWVPITRLTFIYHYFPSVPFVVLMLGYSINLIYVNAKNKKAVMYSAFGYTAVILILFAMFYPVLSGANCSPSYATTWLKWFDSWVLL